MRLVILREQLGQLGRLPQFGPPHERLRPYLAPLYEDLRSGKGTLRSIHACDWRCFRDSLSPEAVIAQQPARVWLPAGARVLEVGPIRAMQARRANRPAFGQASGLTDAAGGGNIFAPKATAPCGGCHPAPCVTKCTPCMNRHFCAAWLLQTPWPKATSLG